MAFNFNWSPLIADTERARDMLTAALNKSPKPPIIVDDITVNELNLGSKPPELEILEIGDLAEDRFRGIFKMRYDGDAYLTLKTRVQANPLNTYLSTKPGFASPETVAASSGLTIPLQITISDIRLDGFVVLVFSKQKGITTVFRNDPLAGLKVSSTFDSILFVRDYLQRTIESQVRNLFMDDLPAIIHRLSLRVFNPEAQLVDETDSTGRRDGAGQTPVHPFSRQPQSLFDSDAWPFESSIRYTLDASDEIYATFSQKNLLRLAALTESQKTLSLFTPSISDTVYRAWANANDRADMTSGTHTPTVQASLSKIQSSLGSSTIRSRPSSTSSHTSESGSIASRPTFSSFASSPTVYTLSSAKSRSHSQRKPKHRVINLRKGPDQASSQSSHSPLVNDEESTSSGYDESTRDVRSAPSLSGSKGGLRTGGRDGELPTPPRSPKVKADFPPNRASRESPSALHRRPSTPRSVPHPSAFPDPDETPRASQILPAPPSKASEKRPQLGRRLPSLQSFPMEPSRYRRHSHAPELSRSLSDLKLSPLGSPYSSESSTGGILEQAWINKMANEIARKVSEEKAKGNDVWRAPGFNGLPDDEGVAPPAYVS